ncbi:blue copper protein-like [Pyrus x bretschneideri]|uniref:blue copper protein-like n=1 Tax=Pyrus x bretschneideri TaxID=225117 RepID=UPI00202E9B1D|nr:blue copper protein-like [Pyrus x bretschneideri]
MATSQLFLILAILAIFAPSILATDYVFGDYKGWTINFDYQAGARGKMFYVGDNLDSVPLTSGKDAINLATPGRKWYICGVSQHCLDAGQKLAITVFPSSFAPSPSPTWGYRSYSYQKENAASSPGPTWGYIN